MAFILKAQCPDCGNRFSLRVESQDKLPEYCPHCGSYVGTDENFVPSKVNIQTGVSKSADATYRAIEETSQIRAEASGDPTQKITDMNDNLKVGEVAAKAPNNVVTQFAAQAKEAMGFDYFQAGLGGELAAAKAGWLQGTGMPALEAIQGRTSVPQVPNVKGMRSNWGGG